MKIRKLGYCCINNTLKKDYRITRTIASIKELQHDVGWRKLNERALQNALDLLPILQWNVANGITLFRLGSMFPKPTEYVLTDLELWPEIEKALAEAGQYAIDNDVRLTIHPSHFMKYGSYNDKVVENTHKEMLSAGLLMDALKQPLTPQAAINIHVNLAKPDKSEVIERFIKEVEKAPDSVKKRLVVENDDKSSSYAIEDLVTITEQTGIPLCFDFHHWCCHPGTLSQHQAYLKAASTWPSGITPLTHFSSMARKYEDKTAKKVKHADYIYEFVPDYDGPEIDVELECKAKELAILKMGGAQNFIRRDKTCFLQCD